MKGVVVETAEQFPFGSLQGKVSDICTHNEVPVFMHCCKGQTKRIRGAKKIEK